jgi:hypothetical protein
MKINYNTYINNSSYQYDNVHVDIEINISDEKFIKFCAYDYKSEGDNNNKKLAKILKKKFEELINYKIIINRLPNKLFYYLMLTFKYEFNDSDTIDCKTNNVYTEIVSTNTCKDFMFILKHYINVKNIEDINEYCVSKAINKNYIKDEYFNNLVKEFCDDKTKEYIKHIKNASNFDLI